MKILRPYHIKVNEEYIHLKLDHQFFYIYMNHKEYQFTPTLSKEIVIHRSTQKIYNTNATFAFQNGGKTVQIPMSKLIYHPQFLNQVDNIAKPYYLKHDTERTAAKTEIDLIINELEQENKKRLIDHALDEWDEALFYQLVKKL